jgi:hypothetical protein
LLASPWDGLDAPERFLDREDISAMEARQHAIVRADAPDTVTSHP